MKPRASALLHLARYPSARPSTLSYLAERDRINEQLRREIAQQKKQERLDRIKRLLRWPAHVWRR